MNHTARLHLSRRIGPWGAILVLAIALGVSKASIVAANTGDTMNKPHHYFVRLLGTREGWPENMTDNEQRIMSEHFAYLRDLTMKKKVIMAGPVIKPTFGLIILQTASEDEARAIMEAEPSVAKGVHRYELQPMTVSLLTDYRSPFRYVKEPDGRVLRKEIVVPASRAEVWKLWTTTDGMKAFLVSAAKIELRPGGPFELYFDTSAAPGLRGSEDCRILSYLPEEMLTFEWNAPPSNPTRRDGERTWVVVQFDEIDPGQTRVRLSHLGWGDGADWDATYAYFDRAWEYVLDALNKHLTER